MFEHTQDTTNPPKPADQYLGFDLKAYQSHSLYSVNDTVLMGGNRYSYAMTFYSEWGWGNPKELEFCSFNLDKKYTTLKGIYGHVDGAPNRNLTLKICYDDKIEILDMKYDDFAESFEIDITDVKVLRIVGLNIGNESKYALAEVKLIGYQEDKR